MVEWLKDFLFIQQLGHSNGLVLDFINYFI